MKFKVISQAGRGLGLACHLSSEGHNVTFDCANNPTVGSGCVSPSKNGHADLVYFDHDSAGRDADTLRDSGQKVLGASKWSNHIDHTEGYAQKVINSIGFNQQDVEHGINLYITLWYNGLNVVSSYSSLLYRRFMAGGHGPDLGCSGFLTKFHTPTTLVKREIIDKVEPILRKVNHRGAFHVHLQVNEDAFKVVEISASMNHPLAIPLFENSSETSTQTLLSLLNESTKTIRTFDPYVCGVFISLPPYPYGYVPEDAPQALSGLKEKAIKHLWLMDSYKEGGKWMTTGRTGMLGYVVARGKKHPKYGMECVRRAYRTISNIQLRDLQYREDIGKDVGWMLSKLKKHNWIS